MSRDYANRKPKGAPKRPARSSRAASSRQSSSKKAPPPQNYPIALILFAVIAVGSFSYFLWNIKDTAKQETPVEVAKPKAPEVKASKPVETKPDRQAVAVKVKEQPPTMLPAKVKEAKETVQPSAPAEEKPVVEAPKKDPNALPPKPKEEWTYLDELENKNVEVDLPAVAATRTPQQYQLQCASFRQEAQAQQMKAVIAFQGLEAQVKQIEGTSGTWYKVILGPYDSKRDTERKRHSLQNAGINGCQLLAIAK